MIKTFDQKIRKALFILYSYREGNGGLLRYKNDFHETYHAPLSEIEENRYHGLRMILEQAYDTTTYYRNLWKNIGFNPYDSDLVSGLESLPVVTKEIIQGYKESMVSAKYKRDKLDVSHTGGSSGTPTSFYRDRECTTARIGRQYGILELCNYSIGQKRALIWGAHQDIKTTRYLWSPKYLLRKYASADEILCCTVLSDSDLYDYHERLLKFKPEILYGYPNAMTQFASFILERNLRPLKVNTIISTAERLTDEQRVILSNVFHGEVFNLYCTREHGCIGFECRKHKGFHIDTGSVLVEILTEGKPEKPGHTGDIVITDLLNYGMPMIRYSIGDRGALSAEPCACGCNLPLLSKLEGRVTDVLYRPDGQKVSGIMMVDMFMDVPEIEAIQIVQEKMNVVDLFMVVTKNYNIATERYAIEEMKTYLGEDVKIKVKLVQEIPRNPISGKHQEVINKINNT